MKMRRAHCTVELLRLEKTTMNTMTTFGPVDPDSRAQLERCLARASDAHGVLCADHHKGYSMPIGGVIASQSIVIPAGVGYDIACGNCAVRTNILAADIDTSKIMDEIFSVISFGVGLKNGERINTHPVYDAIATSPVKQQRGMLELARAQLGTVGSGNHYVDLFEDRDDGQLWIGVHFGSRGFGHKTACGFLALANHKEWGARVDDGMDAPPVTIPIDTPLGEDYLAAMEIAGDYAYAGRNWVVNLVLHILGAQDTQRIHNHHNYAWKEQHFGEQWLVVRKGSTPAFPGQQGFVGGSMGDDAVIVEGVESHSARNAMYSTIHGAGRVMSRTQAAGKMKTRKVWKCGQRACDYMAPWAEHMRGNANSRPLCPKCDVGKLIEGTHTEQVRAGVVDWPTWQSKLKAQGVELRGAGADEAPECYKQLSDVLAYHAGTIRILNVLRPIGVAMAGGDVVDPYKD